MQHGKIVPIDFETKGIEHRPKYPPEPVGLAVKWEGKWQYLSWGHKAGGNNSTKTEAKKILREIFKNHTPLMHNAGFDIEVAVKKFSLPWPKDFHDTLFLAYLYDPRATSLSLKPLADEHLDMPPQEQDAVRDWILEHTDCKGTKKDPWGARIWEAPAGLVSKYAKGDIIRTERLYKFFLPYIKEKGMYDAYTRERQCLPIFNAMSDRGIRVAVPRLTKDLKKWNKTQEAREDRIRKTLKAPDLEIFTGKQLADALEKAGKIDDWVYTDKGNRSTSAANLNLACTDADLNLELQLRGMFETFTGTFAKPWLEQANSEGSNGRVYPTFSQVRTPDEHGTMFGTRTGRPSSSKPNFLNIPRHVKGGEVWVLGTKRYLTNVEIPFMREYIIPDEKYLFLLRDYSQQEMRILAHFEEGALYQAYLENPREDAHIMVTKIMNDLTGQTYGRTVAKAMNFGKIYGMGLKATAHTMRSELEEAKELDKVYRAALPDITNVIKDIQNWSKKGNPIYTWGGREYFTEPPAIVKGRRRDFHYKLVNYLIQGSGADCTKEAMIRSTEALKDVDGFLVLQVYDEVMATVPVEHEKKGMILLRDAMESIEFDIPMLTDGKVARRSWGQARKTKI